MARSSGRRSWASAVVTLIIVTSPSASRHCIPWAFYQMLSSVVVLRCPFRRVLLRHQGQHFLDGGDTAGQRPRRPLEVRMVADAAELPGEEFRRAAQLRQPAPNAAQVVLPVAALVARLDHADVVED